MTLSQFNCPHCSGPFQVDISLPLLQVACPHCGQPIAFASEPPVSEPPVSEPPMASLPLSEPPPTEPPFTAAPSSHPRSYLPADMLPPGVAVSTNAAAPQPIEEQSASADDFRSRQPVVDDRASRKFVKNMIVWVCCTIVLVLILAYFLK